MKVQDFTTMGAKELFLFEEKSTDQKLKKLKRDLLLRLARARQKGGTPPVHKERAAFRRYADEVAKAYAKLFKTGPWNKTFTAEDRQGFARVQWIAWTDDYRAGRFAAILPPKKKKGKARFKIGDRVQAGRKGTADYDEGEIVEIVDGKALVAWNSLAKTWVPEGGLKRKARR